MKDPLQGQTIPFHAMFAIRVWDKTRDGLNGLNAKAGAIKNAINSMNAAQYFESNLPSTSRTCSLRHGRPGLGGAMSTASFAQSIVSSRTCFP